MARFTEEERIELTKKLADYIIETKASTRKTAQVFGISNATVSTWINEVLIEVDYAKYQEVSKVLLANTPKTVEDEAIKNRVLKAANLVLAGFEVQEIAKAFGDDVTINIINEDLQTRLPRISKELYEQVNAIKKAHSKANLWQGSNIYKGQMRDEHGRFTK